MGHIKAYYERITQLPENDWRFISSRFVQRIFKKGEIITYKGRTEHYLSFIETGIVRFYIPGDEKEQTINFCFDKEFTCIYESFLTQTAAHCQLIALTDVVMWSIDYNALQLVYTSTRVGNYLGRCVAERLLLAKEQREILLLNQSATERYLQLFTDHLGIIKHIPLKYIASYLGITPQGLSRIRRQIN